MQNIAFTTLLVLFLAVPGYLFRACYYSNDFTRQVLPKSLADDLVRAILFSLPFHILGVAIVETLQHKGITHATVTFDIAFRLLAAQYGDQFTTIARALYDNLLFLIIYYGLIVGVSIILGHALRQSVWKREWDVSHPWLFRFRSPWLYRLMGRGQLPVPFDRILVYADVLTDLEEKVPGKKIIYRGIVAGFSTEDDGSLRDIFLTVVYQGKFKEVQGQAGKYDFSWKRIQPGDYMVFKYSDVKNLNLTYKEI